jgi:hypothetical protein
MRGGRYEGKAIAGHFAPFLRQGRRNDIDNEPIAGPCPKCGAPFVVEKRTKQERLNPTWIMQPFISHEIRCDEDATRQ